MDSESIKSHVKLKGHTINNPYCDQLLSSLYFHKLVFKLALNVGAVSTSIYSGLMLRINAVQVLDLVTGGQGGASAFDKEDGFVAEPKPVAKVAEGEDETIDF